MNTRDDLDKAIHAFITERNNNRTDGDPKWEHDFGCRMHYDGDLYGLSSMFFPKEGAISEVGSQYEGSVSVIFNGDEQVCSVEVDCKTLKELGDRCYVIYQAYAKTIDENRKQLDEALKATALTLSS